MRWNQKIVSFESEKLILVDDHDNEVGFRTKAECHDGDGMLHRAFSVFIFNHKRELLLQQRAADKRLWPLFWSNSCCSHPRQGERIESAALRRMEEELGIKTDLTFLFKFKYKARFQNKGAEHELCSVFIGISDQIPVVNETEIAEWKYIPIKQISTELSVNPDHYSPWFKMEWERMMEHFAEKIERLFSGE